MKTIQELKDLMANGDVPKRPIWPAEMRQFNLSSSHSELPPEANEIFSKYEAELAKFDKDVAKFEKDICKLYAEQYSLKLKTVERAFVFAEAQAESNIYDYIVYELENTLDFLKEIQGIEAK